MDVKQDRQKHYQISSTKQDSKLTIYLAGEFGLKNLLFFTDEIKKLLHWEEINKLEIDFSKITYFDSAAALSLIQIQKIAAAKTVDCTLINLNNETKGIFSVIYENALIQKPLKAQKTRNGLIEQIGEASFNIYQDAVSFITFFGELLFAISYIIFHPRSLRTKDVFFYMKRAGVDG
ncbi:MAG: STAS domain-containing protein, partial [Smithella sp.]